MRVFKQDSPYEPCAYKDFALISLGCIRAGVSMAMYTYLISAALILIAISRVSLSFNRVKTRDISGNVVVGDVSGTVLQNSITQAANERKRPPDRISWIIGIAGVLIAVAQLAHDLLR